MEDFRVDFSDPVKKRAYINYCQSIEFGDLVICHNAIKYQRDLPINNYYWGVVLEKVSMYTGYIPEELHEIFVADFLPTVTFQNFFDLTTTDCTNEQMWRYITRIRFWFHKFSGRIIPAPNEAIRVPELTWGEKDRR